MVSSTISFPCSHFCLFPEKILSGSLRSSQKERKQGWRQKLICSSSTQHVCAASSLFKSGSKSGVRKLSTAGSCGGSAEICEGQPAPWLSTWPTKQLFDQHPPPKMKGMSRFFTIGLVAAWYSSNIGVLLLNKYLLTNYGFKYPIFLTMCHMTACSLFSYIAIAWFKVVPLQTIRSRVQFFKISALSFIFCISVVFGNISLRYLPVSFNQAIGATTPFFTAVFAYLMTLKREAWLTYVTLIPVVTGVVIASGSEPSFHLFGFLICVAATAARALKSVLQGILLSAEGEKLNSMNLLLYMAPMAVVFLLPATLFMEDNVVGITIALARDDVKIIWYLLFNSSLAYFVNLTNFLVTKHTSALTLQVLGNAKGAVAVVVSILIFRNPVSVTGMFGYTLTVMGVILYSEAKKGANKS
ncbi:probable sugar phosphate/phosphate translocator At3g11320 isoform X1 [Cucurbita maxima]|uniref:Probable sugar phosphate/phosphate translocator At3g11320 isoform X1 n=1 Tax=Cucurbita maxima TaxID=3661 RepID=A0A6J1JQX1_CUCMA|nr:probable sugar phosphate/phosphate translocator At3g11320 isoform X1 [Cucurbita maxima]